MRWLIIQSDGEHKGQDGWTPNWYLRECYSIQHAIINNGMKADVWGLRHDNFKDIPDFNSYDFILCIENYENKWLPDFSKITRPVKLQWIIDLHCQDQNFYDYLVKDMNIILHSTKSLINSYKIKHNTKKHLWFPNGVDDRYFKINEFANKKHNIVFVGSKNIERKEFIEKLEREIGLEYFFATGQDMINKISESKIHFNKNIGCDMNYRIFETIGLGTCLITNFDETLYELGFKEGENIVTYNDIEDVKIKITNLLVNEDWKRIGKNGYDFSKSQSYTKRIENLMNEI